MVIYLDILKWGFLNKYLEILEFYYDCDKGIIY